MLYKKHYIRRFELLVPLVTPPDPDFWNSVTDQRVTWTLADKLIQTHCQGRYSTWRATNSSPVARTVFGSYSCWKNKPAVNDAVLPGRDAASMGNSTLEDEDTTLPRNVGIPLPTNTASYRSGRESSAAPLWKPKKFAYELPHLFREISNPPPPHTAEFYCTVLQNTSTFTELYWMQSSFGSTYEFKGLVA